MRKKLLSSLLLGLLALPYAAKADVYVAPTIQQGNILHCFNWKVSDIQAELDNIYNAGFTSIQLSPMQRNVSAGAVWNDAYRPYDFKFIDNGMGSKAQLKALCDAAHAKGMKIIVDVVFNHVDGWAAGDRTAYHDPWWNSNNRLRWNGNCDWGNRYSVTHNQMGGGDGYPDVNSEDSEVAARGKAYIDDLKSIGVDGIRYDAAKHVGLPSEGCNFWATVCSDKGLYYYGEILNDPAGDTDRLMKEYTNYMTVTDNNYGDNASKNGGVPTGAFGWTGGGNTLSPDKVIYWGESHDTYANQDGFSKNIDQSIIDRAYAAVACRNGENALYLSRPSARNNDDIKIGAKGSTAFTGKHIAEVNKFRNAMVGKADYFSGNGNACSITRQGGGAVIVMKGSGNVSIANGNGYCPAGTYTDKVSGGTFTVTASTISGNVGSSGIAVIYNGGDNPDPNPNPNPDPTPGPTPTSGMYVLGDLGGTAAWTNGPGTGVALTQDGTKYVGKGVTFTPAKTGDKCYFNFTDYVGATWDDINTNGNRYGATAEGVAASLTSANTMTLYAGGVNGSACGSWTVDAGSYDISVDPSAMSFTIVKSGDTPNPDPTPGPTPSGTLTITGDYNLAYSGNLNKVHYWGGSSQSTWPGVEMTTVTGSDGKSYKVAKVADGTTGVLFNSNGDADKTGDLAYTGAYVMDNNGATSTAVTFSNGNNPDPNPGPTPTPGDHTVYFDNSSSNWSTVYCYTWTAGAADQNAAWPGVAMTKVDGNVYSYTQSAAPANVIFTKGDDSGKTKDLTWVDGHIYKADGTHQEYQGGNNPTTKPVVTANPGNTQFATSVVVTLSVTPSDAKIYYTTDGSTPSASSKLYSAPLTFTETTTLKAVGIATDGTVGNVVTYTYTFGVTPIPDPTPVNGNNLITDYYKVNPNGQVGTQRTVNMSFNEQRSTTAMSNWSASDLIAQGVARDVAQAFKGHHEYPVVDSYALYASWDNDYLYLGVQMVYTVWDLYGDGKLPGQAKPYNFDGRMVWAFDLDPNKKFDGYINGTGAIWNDNGAPGIKFDNGVDAMWIGSTKPGNGTPGFFIPTADGHASYDAGYCLSIPGSYYGYADGLLPHTTQVWGQKEFGYEPDALKGNDGFVDLTGEIEPSAHTFYEFKFPLSVLGITADYIKNTGIGVQYIDVYGSSGVGGTPYDPAFFDNAKDEYSMDPSSSKEKEDEDILTYAPARVGKLAESSAIEGVAADTAAATTVSIVPVNGGVKVTGLQGENVQVVAVDGRVIKSGSVATSELRIELPAGMYVVRAGSAAKTVMVK
ncbi:MAG: starch-binding protein [Candidatus Amulumruptor caecigallinarius]|nr:starch-binding protein [Candidatus Amulumruptor caecigallinarius]MCM1397221.1 starch-binding protein [Candidatus Amulumruptor caecigallinarius]MCM1454782.1 starch-binding protein [bacterium]